MFIYLFNSDGSCKIRETLHPEVKPEDVAAMQGLDFALSETLYTPDDMYFENGDIVLKTPKPTQFHIFNYTTKQWTDPRTLDDLKAAKWEQAKSARDAAEYGGFTWDGSTFDSDSVATGRITGAAVLALMASMAGQPYSIVWTLFDNTTRVLDASQMMAVGAALGTHVQAAHDAADARRLLINAATSAAELDAMVW